MTPLDLVVGIGSILDRLNIEWVLGGSLASSIVGEPRSTLDIDVAVLLDRRQITRRQAVELDSGEVIWVGSADDQVLRKLSWFRAGGHTSDRQWRDVVAILTVQGDRIDRVELQRTADELGLGDLAARAIAKADSPMTRASH